uniref:Uncharacterized protein n=1 Tax=viral metagenome TaxID=1070528 RepID=A0A6C0I5J8_9ZZZZ
MPTFEEAIIELKALIDDLHKSTIAGTGGYYASDTTIPIKKTFDDIHRKIDGLTFLSPNQLKRWKTDIQRFKNGIYNEAGRFKRYKLNDVQDLDKEFSPNEIWVFLVQSYNSMGNGSPQQMLSLSLDDKKIALIRICKNMAAKMNPSRLAWLSWANERNSLKYSYDMNIPIKIIEGAPNISDEQYRNLSQTLNNYSKNMTFKRGALLEGNEPAHIVFYNGAFSSYIYIDQLYEDMKSILKITTGGKKCNPRKTKNTGKIKTQTKNTYTQRNKNKKIKISRRKR